jgi:hypothetical protein
VNARFVLGLQIVSVMVDTPQSFAATSTLTVPVTFASFEASGSFTDRGTEGMAAWWKMPSAPGKVSMSRSRSVMLPSMNVTRG